MSLAFPSSNKYERITDFHILLGFKFEPIKSFITSTDQMILAKEKELNKKIEEWDKLRISEKSLPEGFDRFESAVMNTWEYRKILHSSLYLSIYSLFETEFKNLCELCGMLNSSELKPKDLAGKNYISQCRKYTEKILNVDLSVLNTKWQLITKYQTLRNSIAHNNGTIKELKPDLETFINSTSGIELNDAKNRIVITDYGFLIKLAELLEEYLKSVSDEIYKSAST